MPLVLNLGIGKRIFLGDQALHLVKIGKGLRARLMLDGEKTIELAGDAMMEVMPGIEIGLVRRTAAAIWLAFEAPRNVLIWRQRTRRLEDL